MWNNQERGYRIQKSDKQEAKGAVDDDDDEERGRRCGKWKVGRGA